MGHSELVHNRDHVKFNDVYGQSIAWIIRTNPDLDTNVTQHLKMFPVLMFR